MAPDQQHNEGDQPKTPDSAVPMNQAELDALLTSMDQKPGESASDQNAEQPETASDGTPNPVNPPAPSPSEQAPEPDSASLEETEPTESDAEKVLGNDADQLLVKQDLDETLPPAASGDADTGIDGIVNQQDIDDLLTSLQEASAESVSDDAQESEADDESDNSAITQDILNALVDAKTDSAPPDSAVGTENLAAAVSSDEGDDTAISQDILDALAKEASIAASSAKEEPAEPPPPVAPNQDVTPDSAPPSSNLPVPDEGPDQKSAPSKPTEELPKETLPERIRRRRARPATSLLKIVSSLAAGILLACATYAFLARHREVSLQTLSAPTAANPVSLEEAMAVAKDKMAQKRYSDAVGILNPAIAAARPGADVIDARYLRIEAKMHELGVIPEPTTPGETTTKTLGNTQPKEGAAKTPAKPRGQVLDNLQSEIDRLIHDAPKYPNVEQALLWKARLYEAQDNDIEARRVYNEILEKFATASNLDRVLLANAKATIRLRLGPEAVTLLNRLLHDFPGSPLAGEARILLGDAYALSGNEKDAQDQYTRVAKAQPDTTLGSEALTRLGQLAFDHGDYLEAIRVLEHRLSSSTTVKGNGPVYLLLARAYRAAGQLKNAERVLHELLDFFEPSEITPAAYVQLCQVLDAEGQRDDAKRLADQTALRYPKDPKVLTNQGMILGETGHYDAAATTLMAADAAGANDPDVLLAAGKYFHLADELPDAEKALQKLEDNYGGQPQALEGGIELAKTRYDMGQIHDALQRLEDLSAATEGRPQRLPVLLALGKMYHDLGLYPRAATILSDATALTAEPAVLAEAATASFDAGNWSDGLALAARVDVSKLKDKPAYDFLTRYGEALLRTDPSKGIEKMEQAYSSYPEQRTENGDQQLLEAYLTTDRSARARGLVMDLEALARTKPVEHHRLERAANTWGDYLYGRHDYQAAADAYALSETGADPSSPEAQWAAYQRANALRQLGDYRASEALYAKIAAGTTPWKNGAALRSDYVKLEERLRDQPLISSPIEANGL